MNDNTPNVYQRIFTSRRSNTTALNETGKSDPRFNSTGVKETLQRAQQDTPGLRTRPSMQALLR